jgi:hypothetical protein
MRRLLRRLACALVGHARRIPLGGVVHMCSRCGFLSAEPLPIKRKR